MRTNVVSRLENANKACQAVASVEKKTSVNVVSASFCISQAKVNSHKKKEKCTIQ